jgi:phosphoglycolate phosphatase
MLLIWDLDGTLIDSRADIATSANAALADLGRPALPLATVVSYIGDGIGALIERLLPDGTTDVRESCRQAFERHYAQGCTRETCVYPGIIETLAVLTAAGHVHAIATNKAVAYVGPILAHCGLTHHFQAVRGGDGRRKPDPWMIQDLGRELAVTPAWMIGDHHTDIRAGRAAGCRVLFCRWGLGHAGGDPVDASAGHPLEIAGLIAAR